MIDSGAKPKTVAEVNELRQAGVVPAKEYLALLQQCRDAGYWHSWAIRALLVLGAGHFLAGVVFFFAYNWDDLTSFTRFGILQFAIVGSFVAALALRIEKPAGQAMLIAASIFTGVLLAVIGQTYQTGADAWELFAAWTALILPWVLASRSSAHWFLWIILCLTAFSLYGEQRLVALGRIDREMLIAVTGLLPMLFLGLRELALGNGLAWLRGNWFRRALVLISMTTLFTQAIVFVFGTDSGFFGFMAFLLLSAALSYVYAKELPDFSIIAIVTGFVALVAMAFGGRVIHEVIGFDDGAGELVLSLFLLGGWCALLTSVSVRLLNALHRQLNPGARNE